jgi:tetratricopeptide (TPR) repeat protein
MFKVALEILKEKADADPQNMQGQLDVGNTFTLMAAPFRNLGRHDLAIKALENAISVYDKCMQDGPNKGTRGVLIQAHFEKAESLARLGRFVEAFEDNQLVLDYLGDKFGEPMTNPAMTSQIPLVIVSRDSVGALAGLNAPDMKLSSSAEVMALLIVAGMDASKSETNGLTPEAQLQIANVNSDLNFETFSELIEYIQSRTGLIDPMPLAMDVFVARVEARRFDFLKSQGRDDSAQAAKQRAVSLLRRFLEANPSLANIVMTESDLIGLRASDEFQAIVPNN